MSLGTWSRRQAGGEVRIFGLVGVVGDSVDGVVESVGGRPGCLRSELLRVLGWFVTVTPPRPINPE